MLTSAGLDAYVFLRFFKMALKYIAFVLFFSLTIIYPVYQKYGKDERDEDNEALSASKNYSPPELSSQSSQSFSEFLQDGFPLITDPRTGYLWIYVVFAYLFSLALMYLVVTETKKVIHVRQRYLSAQSSITDRTIRLSGIPPRLRSEQKITETIENLEIGKVENVTLCKDWRSLDDKMTERVVVLRKLEEAWTAYLGRQGAATKLKPSEQIHNESEQEPHNVNTPLLEDGGAAPDGMNQVPKGRPTTRIRAGWFKPGKKVDAIDYYEEKLQELDENIKEARDKDYVPTPLAFVTLDSTAACQMAIQAIIDPEPMQLIAKPAPAPADVVWRNTYLSRRNRMIRAWVITAIVLILSVVWLSILFPFAVLLNLKTIEQFSPQLATFLEEHKVAQSLVRTSLPTIGMSALNALVPFLYDWLSNLQGMTSQGDVEMSIISKNFFFTFFNLFVAFTLIGTASTAYQLGDLMDKLRGRFGNILGTSYVLAQALNSLGLFYQNLILLQGVGLFPFRLLEFGPVFLYPIMRMGAKTPRGASSIPLKSAVLNIIDFAELTQPPIFSYGFFLPSTLFVFSICIVYSALPDSQLVAVFGIIYFVLGHFVYKYQLLYAMDHRHFSTGRAWPMICIRVLVALIFFQVAMAGQMLLKGAIPRTLLIAPLLIGTIWFAIWYNRTYEPLMRFIALRSLHEADEDDSPSLSDSRNEENMHASEARAVDGDESNWNFINPNLVIPLEDVWISKDHVRTRGQEVNAQQRDVRRSRVQNFTERLGETAAL